MRLALFVSLLFFIYGCNDKKTGLKPYESKCVFNEEFKHLRWINLSKHLGDSMTIEKDGSKKTFLIEFDSKHNINTITELGKGKKFEGTATKYKDIYFLNTAIDSTYQLTVLREENGSIQGLDDFEFQIKILDNIIEKGFHRNLIAFEENGHFYLKTEKKELRTLFSEILLKMPLWQIKN